MNEDTLKSAKKFLYIMAIYFIIVIGIVIYTNVQSNKNTSTPVEEMYHRQLVITLDSILDARFGPGCYKEVIDNNNVSVSHTRFGDILSPTD